MSERLKEHAWKACVLATVPRVRIPLSPPFKEIQAPVSYGNIDSRVLFCFLVCTPKRYVYRTLAGAIVCPMAVGLYLFHEENG